jgi:hypothetical protein
MRTFTTAISVAVLLGLSAVTTGTILHVPGEYSLIQAAIDAAADGDTVLIADGIYTGDRNRDLDFHGKAILVTSENGPRATIIDSEGSYDDFHRAFSFQSGEGESSVVKGLGIRGGFYYYFPGGGIRCVGSSPTIVDCIFEDNIGDQGGGIYCEGGAPVIVGNLFLDNLALTT